ncbi:hypothetical protein [Streptacidiphilus carbonis]|uniref:hypothetical protein n=1 Tax=Streptacidiphilus carbonis TaxID=105422 RepID=UPI0005A7BBEF|nr:hypothetical protein [Streptacidiphilus carbonis]
MAVFQISLADCLDGARPPDQILTLAVVDDTVFVAVEKYTEVDAKESRQKEKAMIAVSLPSLREALELLANDRSREDLRPVDGEHGDMGARLKGPRAGWVKL